jgi:hypothetical protein
LSTIHCANSGRATDVSGGRRTHGLRKRIVLRTPCLAQMGPVVLRVSATSHGTPAVSPSRGRLATACPLRSGPRPISADTPLMQRPPLTTDEARALLSIKERRTA